MKQQQQLAMQWRVAGFVLLLLSLGNTVGAVVNAQQLLSPLASSEITLNSVDASSSSYGGDTSLLFNDNAISASASLGNMRRIFSRQAAASTCPVCFNCQNTACQNFGSCGANQACSCPDGWGSTDCSKPLCGSLAEYNASRPISTLSGQCACNAGWEGPNCNICQSTDSCGQLPTSTLGGSLFCNQSPVVWGNRHFSTCNVSNSLLKLAYNQPAYVTTERNAGAATILATMWLGYTPQFGCLGSQCVQTFSDGYNQTSWDCAAVSCNCVMGTAMCGGGNIDISSTVNGASGAVGITCTDPTTCNLDLQFIKAFFPKGISLLDCFHGECVSPFASPINQITIVAPIDAYGITAISTGGGIIFIILVLIGWGCIDRQKKRGLPPPSDHSGMQINFSDICYSVGKKRILDGISGSVAPGELLAIMGPSGSGKTTFLDILARKRKGGVVSGEMEMNGSAISDEYLFKRITGYVDQEDIHIPCLTVRETLEFSAAVRLPESLSNMEKTARVDEVLKQLGLFHVANSRVGDSLNRGISGGEKKRLSIAIELVTNPSVLFIDEPTSGLDSYNAMQVVQTLSTLAHEHKKTVIFTVHQPNSTIFSLFTRVLLLSRGKVVYFGAANEANDFCTKNDRPCPPSYHIADHLLDVASSTNVDIGASTGTIVSVDSIMKRRRTLTGASRDKALKHVVSEPATGDDIDASADNIPQDSTDIKEINIIEVTNGEKAKGHSAIEASKSFVSFSDRGLIQEASTLTQIEKVLGRTFKIFYRRPVLFISHTLLSIVLGVFIGMLYYHVDSSLAGLQNRLGSIFFMQALLAFGGLSAISSLSEDRVLFIRERSNGFYGYFPYFLSKILFDLIPLRIIPSLLLCLVSYYLIGFDPAVNSVIKFHAIMVVFSMNASLHGFLIACMIPETSTATLAAVMSILFQMLFSGILVNQVNIPSGLSWLQYISFFKYAYEACIATETQGLNIESNIAGVTVQIPASTVLTSFGLDGTAYYRDLTITLGLFFGFLLLIALLMNFRLKERK